MSSNAYLQALENKSSVDKFVMVLPVPEILKELNKTSVSNDKYVKFDQLQFSIFGTVAPQQQVEGQEVRYAGQSARVSSHSRPAWPEIDVQFKVDNLFYNYWVIDRWLHILNNQKESYFDVENLGTEFLNEYGVDFTVTGKDEYNQDIVQFYYRSGFPTSISNIDWNYQNHDEILCTCTFAYSQMETSLVLI